jgi:hypothetical protein
MSLEYKNFREMLAEVKLRNGRVSAWHDIRRCVNSYSAFPTVLRVWLTHEEDAGSAAEMNTFAELRSRPGIDFRQEIARAPQSWAQLFASTTDIGSVLYPDIRFRWLTDYGLDLRAIAPRGEKGELVFLTLDLGLYSKLHPIREVRIDTRTLDASVRQLTTTEDLKNGTRTWSTVA